MVHPLECRQYNSFYDEWDLWFTPSWGLAQDDALDTRATDSNSNTALQNNFHLSSWYGLTLADTRTFPEVDYDTWGSLLRRVLPDMAGGVLPVSDPAAIKCIAGWVAAVFARDWRSRALQHTWDLDVRNPLCLLRADPDPRRMMEFEHHRAADREGKADPDHVSRWVRVRFRGDDSDSDAADFETDSLGAGTRERAWSLFTSPMGALLLARRLSEADTRRAALCTLVAVGVPVRTGVLRRTSEAPASNPSNASPPNPNSASASASLPTGSEPTSKSTSTSAGAVRGRRRLLIPYREKRDRPTLQDYDAYCQRVLELSHAPHARAAWLKGGIVWRLMLEVTGRNMSTPGLPTRMALEEELAAGPSGGLAVGHCEAVTREVRGAAYVDDALEVEELDVIAGVVKVYTGEWCSGLPAADSLSLGIWN